MNKIEDISTLKSVNFPKLKELNLSNNKISDINVFEKIKFEQLENLNLSKNLISDITALGIIRNNKF